MNLGSSQIGLKYTVIKLKPLRKNQKFKLVHSKMSTMKQKKSLPMFLESKLKILPILYYVIGEYGPKIN